MKNIIVFFLVFLSFLFACNKQKNVDEFDQFLGKWKLISKVFNGPGNSLEPFNPKPLYSNIEGIACEFLNDGYFTFTSDKFGKERFRIKSFVKKDILYFASSTTHITTEGYSLTLFNKTGKKFLFFLALDPFTHCLYTDIWYKGIPYYSAQNGFINQSKNGELIGSYEKY